MAIISYEDKKKNNATKANKSRQLRSGERKRKNGGYEYRYTTKTGERKSIYAKTLEELDEKKESISINNYYNIKPNDYKLNDVYNLWKERKTGVKDNTKQNWFYMYECYAFDKVGKNKLKDLKLIDLQDYYTDLIENRGLAASTVDSIHTVIHSVLDYAIRNDWIRNNPAREAFKDIKKQHKKTTKRVALTKKQQETFIDFLAHNEKYRRWWSVFVFMIETGLRVGEFTGLTKDDVDDESVDVNHTLVYYNKYSEDRKSYYEVHTPKTISSVRNIPLSNLAKEALKFEKEYQEANGLESKSTFIGTKMEKGIELQKQEFKDFLFLNRFGEVLNQGVLNKALRHIIEECNSEIEQKTKGKCKEEDKLPRFSCHNLRHTYITRLCEANINPRVIMHLAGHSTMEVTMQIYTTISKDYEQEVFKNIEGYIADQSIPHNTPKIPRKRA